MVTICTGLCPHKTNNWILLEIPIKKYHVIFLWEFVQEQISILFAMRKFLVPRETSYMKL